ncbi:hypothetical protein CDL12_22899 [Handroanthus impetiginosus]|nr:hypothetical protein CDL12_22899 [Handroanthus impetiginosus]
MLLKDLQLADTLLGHISGKNLHRSFDSYIFSAAISEWEAYTFKLRKELVLSLPYWRTHESIFSVVNLD